MVIHQQIQFTEEKKLDFPAHLTFLQKNDGDQNSSSPGCHYTTTYYTNAGSLHDFPFSFEIYVQPLLDYKRTLKFDDM